jgi:hypothetical protein
MSYKILSDLNPADTAHPGIQYNTTTKHPIEQGHKLWADYVYENIK